MDFVAFFNGVTMKIAMCAKWPFFLRESVIRITNIAIRLISIVGTNHKGHVIDRV